MGRLSKDRLYEIGRILCFKNGELCKGIITKENEEVVLDCMQFLFNKYSDCKEWSVILELDKNFNIVQYTTCCCLK